MPGAHILPRSNALLMENFVNSGPDSLRVVIDNCTEYITLKMMPLFSLGLNSDSC